NDHCVTVRDRDTMEQRRINIDAVVDYVRDRISEKRVRIPQGPFDITGNAGADGSSDVNAEAGVDESTPVQVTEVKGE
ncbi:MAG: His/Gly/Thr/Pro-type tRNA ligase C-terminal domain-containing protein, partial [Aeriscardovia aeriphila]|nr:His/Gly/Thr/Pro-type tRNA ligase C-terminal domain-containing protein [Aeriscardovia aeriphila]